MDLLHYFIEGIDWKSTLFGAVFGALVSFLFQAILKLFKPSKKDYHISLLTKGEARYFSGVEDGGVNVEVKHQGVILNGEIAVLEIDLYNDGKNAINYADHFNRPIYIKSDKYKIISAKTIDSSVVGAKISDKEDGTICLSWGLLKHNESIRVQLVGQRIEPVKDKKNKDLSPFYNSLKFSVRSDCVDYLDSGDLTFKLMMPYMVLGLLVMACLHIFLFNEPKAKEYNFRVNDEMTSGVLTFDQDNNVFIVQHPDSLKVSDQLSLKKHPRVGLNVAYSRGRAIELMLGYLGFIAFILVLGFVLTIAGKQNNKRMVFEE